MASLLSNYWTFLNKQAYPNAYSHDPKDFAEIENGIYAVPNLITNMIMWTIFFIILNVITPIIVEKLYPSWFASLPKRKQQELAPHIVMLLHHCTAVPYAYYVIYIEYVHDYIYPYSDHVAFYLFEQQVMAFSFGMVVADTFVYAIPKLFAERNAEYLLHHIVTLYVVVELLIYKDIYIRYLPHFLICDTTNLFYCLAWILRLYKTSSDTNKLQATDHNTASTQKGQASSMSSVLLNNFLTFCEVMFVVCFTFIRGVNLMAVLYIMYNLPITTVALGLTRYGILIIGALQVFWLYKIYQLTYKKFFAPASFSDAVEDEMNGDKLGKGGKAKKQ